MLKNARDMRDEILRNEAFKTALERHAQDTGKSVDTVRKEAAGYLKEMAANFSLRYVEGMCVAMAILWNRSFSGLDIDEAGLAHIREAAREAPIVLVPAHRSHIDYLAISWILYNHGLIPPHIAAGINLSFWPMGHIFRRSGAFFLRRSFKGNPLYAMTFQAYMRKLVKEGYWVEFFIEGGRSRTGKSLPPKLGMLSNFVEAVFDGATRDLYFVPVSIGSERVLEEGAYSRELSGAEKKNENLGAMLRASKVLGSKHGLLNAHFHTPISLKQFVADKGLEAETASAEGPAPHHGALRPPAHRGDQPFDRAYDDVPRGDGAAHAPQAGDVSRADRDARRAAPRSGRPGGRAARSLPSTEPPGPTSGSRAGRGERRRDRPRTLRPGPRACARPVRCPATRCSG